jgi:hypothetical protein
MDSELLYREENVIATSYDGVDSNMNRYCACLCSASRSKHAAIGSRSILVLAGEPQPYTTTHAGGASERQ